MPYTETDPSARAPDEVEQERRGGGGVRFEQFVPRFEDVGFHSRERLHPR